MCIRDRICITPSALSEPQLTSVFHGIDRVVHRVADPDKESSTLMAQVEEAELKQQQDFIKKARKKSIPRCTVAIMAICTIFLVLEYLLAYLDGNMAVSYTHLDVYKRQEKKNAAAFL